MPETGAEEQRERELKFDIPHDWQLPEPTKLIPAGGSLERRDVQLETGYFDTAGRDLLRNRITLRRRSGDTDTGWHLKVPDGDARTEIRLPLGGRGVPAELRTATLGVRAGAALRPVASLVTSREIHQVLDADGSALLEIVVDSVMATQTREFAITSNWREVEVELLAGDERLLKRTAKWLGKQGALPAESGSKLGRALGVPKQADRDRFTLAGLVGSYLDEQHEAILRGDLALRRGINAVHPTRVATRRYRSVLRVMADLFGEARAAALDDELAWFAAALGSVRDRHVLRAHLDEALRDYPVAVDVSARIDETLGAELDQAMADLDAVMRSRRYYALLAELRDWREQLPIESDAPAGRVAKYLDNAERVARKRLKKSAGGAGRNPAEHRARKAAKRARYVAELSTPELGGRARSSAKRHKKIQEELGDRQDGTVASEFLQRVAIASGGEAAAGFALGALAERQLH